jgi:hypothetical protein
MAEKLQNTEKHIVTKATYDEAREVRANGRDLSDSLLSSNASHEPEEFNERNFVMRLLFGDRLQAEDRLVMIVATDDLSAEYGIEGPRPLFVSVRPILEDGSTGKQEPPYRLAEDGIILNENENTPNVELGYFVGVPGVNVDDFYAIAAEKQEIRVNRDDEASFQNYRAEINKRFI